MFSPPLEFDRVFNPPVRSKISSQHSALSPRISLGHLQ
jgi:hypothetical protein